MKRFLLVLLAAACTPALAPAQTLKVVPVGDSAFVVASLPTCTVASPTKAGTCPDSIVVSWIYGDRAINRVLIPKAKASDTLRVKRAVTGFYDVGFSYRPIKTTRKSIAVPPQPLDTLFRFFALNGIGSIPKATTMAPGDSVMAVCFIRASDGTRIAPTSTVAWAFDATVLRVSRATHLADTVWLVAK